LGDSTLAESSTGNTRLTDRTGSGLSVFFIGVGTWTGLRLLNLSQSSGHVKQMVSYSYQGWQVSIFPTHSNQHFFQCLPPGADAPLSTDEIYSSIAATQQAANRFIKQRIIRDSISVILDNLVDQSRIENQDYQTLLTLIAELSRL
jgi:hypothetical protein